MKRKLRVFLSHSHRDKDIAARIARLLKSNEFEVWNDEEILPGANWAQEVAKALDRSEVMVILLSPDYLNSQWARRDIEFALTQPKFEGRVIPVLLRPSKDVPWILEELNLIDVTRDRSKAGQLVLKALRSSLESARS